MRPRVDAGEADGDPDEDADVDDVVEDEVEVVPEGGLAELEAGDLAVAAVEDRREDEEGGADHAGPVPPEAEEHGPAETDEAGDDRDLVRREGRPDEPAADEAADLAVEVAADRPVARLPQRPNEGALGGSGVGDGVGEEVGLLPLDGDARGLGAIGDLGDAPGAREEGAEGLGARRGAGDEAGVLVEDDGVAGGDAGGVGEVADVGGVQDQEGPFAVGGGGVDPVDGEALGLRAEEGLDRGPFARGAHGGPLQTRSTERQHGPGGLGEARDAHGGGRRVGDDERGGHAAS